MESICQWSIEYSFMSFSVDRSTSPTEVNPNVSAYSSLLFSPRGLHQVLHGSACITLRNALGSRSKKRSQTPMSAGRFATRPSSRGGCQGPPLSGPMTWRLGRLSNLEPAVHYTVMHADPCINHPIVGVVIAGEVKCGRCLGC